jgi:hypothetical protein
MKTTGDPGLRSAAHDMPEPGRRLTHPEGLSATNLRSGELGGLHGQQAENPGF